MNNLDEILRGKKNKEVPISPVKHGLMSNESKPNH